jgi:hypothetical protein
MTFRIIFAGIVFISLNSACNNQSRSVRVSNTNAGIRAMTTTQRDISINKSNAYNDLFLDSEDVNNFIATQRLNDTLAVAIRSFYNARNFEYAWFASTGLIEQAFSFHSLYCTDQDCDTFNKAMESHLDKIRVEEDTVIDPKDPVTIKTELQLTLRFIHFALENYQNRNISAADLGIYIPAKKMTIAAMAESVLADNSANRTYEALNESYGSLKVQLAQYNLIVKKGGWSLVVTKKKNCQI